MNADRPKCAHTMTSLDHVKGRRRGEKPWWRRPCKRWAQSGSAYCWQHQGGPLDEARP